MRIPSQAFVPVAAFGGFLGLTIVAAIAAGVLGPDAETLFTVLAALVLASGIVYLVWNIHPAWSITGGLILTIFNGNWSYFGLPGFFAPDRLLLLAAVTTVVLRGPGARDLPPIRFRGVHVLLAATIVYALGSSMIAQTLFAEGGFFRLLDRLGLIPFMLYVIGPVVYSSPMARRILLGALVGLGGYLGLTSFFQIVGPQALVFPRYILDPDIGIHVGRARGPFAQAAVNGFAMFVCGSAALVAIRTWEQPRWRMFAAGVTALCAFGLFLTLQRSIWLGASVAVIGALVSIRELRRFIVPVLAGTFLAVTIALSVVPGLAEQAQERRESDGTVYDRRNLNTAAIRMLGEYPLTGVGWANFTERNDEFYKLNEDYPLGVPPGLIAHNVFLSNAAELGLLGMTLWIAAILAAIHGVITARPPPDLRWWRYALAPLLLLWIVVANASPLTDLFPNAVLWLLAGVVTGQPAPALARDPARSRVSRVAGRAQPA